MNDEKKQPTAEEHEDQAAQAAPDTQAAQQQNKAVPERGAASKGEETETAQKSGKSERDDKSRRDFRKKEKTYTLTREQMEAAELAVKQLAAAKDQFIRLNAEYENYRKRTAKEKETIYQDAKIDTIKAFLSVYDNLERAVSTDSDPDSPHRKGLEMIFSQYREILGKLGVTEMDAQGKPFDPNRHNAVMHIEDDTLGENVVADVFQAGFMLGDKVLRFATVRVAN